MVFVLCLLESFVVPVRRLWLGDGRGGSTGIWLFSFDGSLDRKESGDGHLYHQPAALITRDEKEQT